MPERVLPGPVQDNSCIREAVCIHTKKVYDSCKDKDCIEDLRLHPTRGSKCIIERALSVKARSAELIWAFVDVDDVAFNRGFYTVDVKYFYYVTADAFVGVGRPAEIHGLCIFDKRVLLYGSEGSAKIFSSRTNLDGMDAQQLRGTNLPTAVVEAVDPIILDIKLVDVCECQCACDFDLSELPGPVVARFNEDLVIGDESKRVYVTLGQFSIIKLERDSQLLIPAYDYCMPDKECVGSSEHDPCELFSRIKFPVDEFFPPDSHGEHDDCGD